MSRRLRRELMPRVARLLLARHGTSELIGPLVDQAELFGLLARLRDLGATLLLVEHLTASPDVAGQTSR